MSPVGETEHLSHLGHRKESRKATSETVYCWDGHERQFRVSRCIDAKYIGSLAVSQRISVEQQDGPQVGAIYGAQCE